MTNGCEFQDIAHLFAHITKNHLHTSHVNITKHHLHTSKVNITKHHLHTSKV